MHVFVKSLIVLVTNYSEGLGIESFTDYVDYIIFIYNRQQFSATYSNPNL